MPSIERRTFLGIALASIPLSMLDGVDTAGLEHNAPAADAPKERALYVAAGQDRDGVHKTLGISTIDFKVTAKDRGGTLLAIENTNRGKGGPAKHSHDTQDEHFYVIDGEYVMLIGPNDSSSRPATPFSHHARCRSCGRMSATVSDDS